MGPGFTSKGSALSTHATCKDKPSRRKPCVVDRKRVEMDGDARCTCPIDTTALMDVEPTSGVITMRSHI
jgi:hypothetical protein